MPGAGLRSPTAREHESLMAERVPDELLETMAVKFRLIGEPTRLAILHALMDGAEKNVGQIVAETGRSEVNVSRHLKQLAKGKMLARRKASFDASWDAFRHRHPGKTTSVQRRLQESARRGWLRDSIRYREPSATPAGSGPVHPLRTPRARQ